MSQTTFSVTEEYPATTRLTSSDRHRLLQEDRRRLALEVLAEKRGPTDLTGLASDVAAREGAVDDETRKQIEIALHHVHLPKLAECDVIDYDPDTHQIYR